jgi:hypothetical protein
MTLPVVIEIVDTPPLIPEFSQIWRPYSHFAHKFVCCKAEADIDEQNSRFNFGTKTCTVAEMNASERDLLPFGFADDLEVAVCHLLTATTIGLPAAFKTKSSVIIVGGMAVREIPMLFSDFDTLLQMARKDGWPPIRDIPVSSTWRWFSHLPGLEEGIVRGPIGRAVAALTHIIYPQTVYGDLSTEFVWALLGLEAIYGRGSTGIGEQLQAKSEVLLGASANSRRNRKRISTAYQFRSRFLHGDIDIPFRYTEDFEHKEILKFGHNQLDAGLFAAALLVSTLQEFVLRNTYEVSFFYNIK